MAAEALPDDYIETVLETARGGVCVRYYDAPGNAAVLMVGGVGGGFDTPAAELYPRLATELRNQATASALRVQFRDPVNLDECIADVLTGIEFLRGQQKNRIVLIGHSAGGAVVLQAALRSKAVVGVAMLSTQSYGTDGVERLGRPLLLIHGEEDEVLPAYCSQQVYRRAREPKQIHIIRGATHVLNEAGIDVHEIVWRWIGERMKSAG